MSVCIDRWTDGLGRITIPKDVRIALGLGATDCVQFRINGDTVTISKRVETNADRIKAMSDEELAEFLLSDICSKTRGNNRDCGGDCIGCVMEWLKQPKEEV